MPVRPLIAVTAIAVGLLGTSACGGKKPAATEAVAEREIPRAPRRPARTFEPPLQEVGAITDGTTPPGPQARVVGDNLGAIGLTHRVVIQHRSAESVLEVVRTHLDNAYTDQELARSSITVDPATNSLLIRAASTQSIWFNDALRVIEQIDVAPAQASVLVALVVRREEWGDNPSEIALQTARQNAWPAAEAIAAARFLAESNSTLNGVLVTGTGEEFPVEARVAMIAPDRGEVAFDYVRVFAPIIAGDGRSEAADEGGVLSIDGTRVPAEGTEPDDATALPVRPVADFRPMVTAGQVESIGPVLRDERGRPVALAVSAEPVGRHSAGGHAPLTN